VCDNNGCQEEEDVIIALVLRSSYVIGTLHHNVVVATGGFGFGKGQLA